MKYVKYIKHIIPLLLITFITILILQLFYVNIINNEEEHCWQELKTTVEDVRKEISIKFTDEISKLHLIETIISNENISPKDISYLHIDKVQPGTMFSRIDILYPDNTLLSNGTLIEVKEDIQFEKIKSSGEYITDRKIDFLNGKPCVYYVLPVLKENEIASVLIGVIDIDILYDLFNPIIYNGQANICVIDADDGNYIMDNWHRELGNAYEQENRKRLDGYENVDLKDEIKNLRSGTIAFVSQTTGKNIYMYYAPLNMFNWEIAIFAQEDVLFSDLLELKGKFITTGIAEILLLVLYFWWNIYLIKQLQKSNNETENKNKQLEFLSYRDVLTGLHNRHKYIETLVSLNHNNPSDIGVAYIDLNGLKHVNDSASHEAGDEYIRKAANILTQVFGENCYRIGGDEFVVITANIREVEFNNNIKKLKDNMKEQNISVSVGYLWQEKCSNINEMLKNADRKMYIEKQNYYKAQDKPFLKHYEV